MKALITPTSHVQDPPGTLAAFASRESHTSRAQRATPTGLPARTTDPLGRLDLLLIATGFLFSLLVALVFGYRRIFWEDEMLGWMLLRDPSWHHMVTAWRLGADGGGFAFYLTGRAWLSLFGPGEIAFRMYSAACFGLAFAVVWVIARRYYSLRVVAFSLFNVFFFSPPLVLHMAEGRFYGLLTLSVALAIAVAIYLVDHPGTLTGLAALATFAAHALVTTSHLLGVVYSCFLLAAQLAIDRKAGRTRPLVYLAGMASWLLLLPERTAIAASARVGKPFFWTTPPTFRRFVGVYSAFSAEIACVLFVLALLLVLTTLRERQNRARTLRIAYQARWPVWIVTLALLLVPLAFLVECAFGPSLFINRYLIPVSIAQVFLTAEAISLIDWRSPRLQRLRQRIARPRAALIGWCAFATALLLWDFAHLRRFTLGQPDYTASLTALLPPGVPVICEDAWTFTEVIGRQHASPVQYVYMLDWPQSLDPSAPRLEVTQFHLMENWRDAGYFSGSIVDRDAFLRTHNLFFVVHASAKEDPNGTPVIGNPLSARFARTPGYQVRPYAHLERSDVTDNIFLVCRGTCPADAPFHAAP